MKLADMIRFHRKKAGLSRKELAELAGIGKTVIFDIENGKETIKLSTIKSILNVLNIEMIFKSPFMNSTKDK